ncbi:DUF58 domain-containing protein [Methanohalobium sp.]|uniref:DUF58 domain-containing protein n=1 Tax=Methanohalobium sp. TaxID=2837493 RepID=UPI0025E0612A|nr:DUF58 domain-containing protein [Methanohalobium sp.]
MDGKKHSIDIDFFRQLDRFTFMVRKRVSTAYAGSRRSIHSGRGIDTVGYRQYYPGDEIRSIDWNVYARTEKLYVRQYEEEKSLTTHILLDTSKSMDYRGSNNTSKFEYGAMIAAGFAYLVTKDNDKFAISTFSENVDIAKPKRGREYLIRTIDRLSETELGGQTSIRESMIQYTPAIRSRSLVVIISDFLDDPESIESAIYRFSYHDLILVQVLDNTEVDLPVYGNSKLIDLETESELKTYISKNFKDEYKKQLENHTNSIREICDHTGADFYTFNTDIPIFDAFFYTISRRRW